MENQTNGRRGFLRRFLAASGFAAAAAPQVRAQSSSGSEAPYLPRYARAQNYKSLKQSSYDRTGGNRDRWPIAAGGDARSFQATGPGVITHIWFTIAARSCTISKNSCCASIGTATQSRASKRRSAISSASISASIRYTSRQYLACSPGKSLNCYFAMPYSKSARFTVTNEGKQDVGAFYSNIDYMTVPSLPDGRALFPRAIPPERAAASPVQPARRPSSIPDGKHNHV